MEFRLKRTWLTALTGVLITVTSLHLLAEDITSSHQKMTHKNSDKVKDQTLLKAMKDSDIQQRQYMIEISRQLGVTCTYCHDLKDFKKADKPAHKVSKTHIEVVKTLNDKYSGQIGHKVDCYMCHRGQAKPDYKEKVGIEHE